MHGLTALPTTFGVGPVHWLILGIVVLLLFGGRSGYR